MNKRQVTLSDLAKTLGISTATVSRALKDYPDISPATKKRVVELAEKLKYRPNSLAASLRKQETHMIGVIIPEVVNHFFSAVIKGIMAVAYETNYRVILSQSDESYEKETSAAQALFDTRVDGLLASLAHGTDNYDHFLNFLEHGKPVVLFDKVTDRLPQVSKVVVNDYQGAYAATQHLIRQGCRHIAHYRGPMSASTSQNRYKGYLRALIDHEVPIDESLILDTVDITHEEGYHFTQYLMTRQQPPDAIFTINDAVAIGAMVALKEQNRRIPQDVAVCGFSDWRMSSIVDPPLSSVAQPAYEMGQQAMRLMIKQINASKENIPMQAETIVLPTHLKVRRSSFAPKPVSNHPPSAAVPEVVPELQPSKAQLPSPKAM